MKKGEKVEREGKGNERSAPLIYFSDYSPHVLRDLEVEFSDLAVLKLYLPKGPRTFFRFIMVVFYILPLFPSQSSALWPNPVPAVLRAALLRARRLPLRVRGSAWCCGRTGGWWGWGERVGKKRRRKERKKSAGYFVCRVETFSYFGAVVTLEILPGSSLSIAMTGRFAPPVPCGGYAGIRGVRPAPGAVPQLYYSRHGLQTPAFPPPRSLPFSLLFFPFLWQKGICHHRGPCCLGDSTGSSFPAPPEGLEVANPPSCCCLSFFLPFLLLQSRTENPAAPWGSPRILSAPSTDSRSQPPPPRAAHRAHSLGTHTCKP